MAGHQLLAGILCAVLLGVDAAAQSPATPPENDHRGYDAGYIGAKLADPILQQAKETYVLFGCAYCHGITLTPRGEAADLTRSPLVGADTDGTVIAALLRAGIPKTTKLSPMPQFSDLSDRQLHDIARYIHYARQQRRYELLTVASNAPGDPSAGSAYFARSCASCHASNLQGIGTRLDAAALRAQLLKPRQLEQPLPFTLDALANRRDAEARQRHGSLLENVDATDVANLVAYLRAR